MPAAAPAMLFLHGLRPDAIVAIRRTKDHGLDLADLSLGFNTDAMANPPMIRPAFMIERARPVRSEVGIPVATSGKLGIPQEADRASPR